MDSTSPLYRQLTNRFFLLFLSFILICSVGFYFYFQYERNLAQFKYQQVPAIAEFNQRQQLLIKSDRILHELINSKYAAAFTGNYLTLIENINKISDLTRNNRRLLEQITQRLKSQSGNVSLLAENERRNIQLKDNVIIQLTLIVDNLALLITEQSTAKHSLDRQINQEKASTRIMTNRINTYSRLLNDLTINQELHQSLIEALVMFNQLDLQYDLAEFDYDTHKIQRTLNNWLASNTVTSETINNNASVAQVLVLEALLFSEQSALAKWRGQLRMAIDFKTELAIQKQGLASLLDKNLVIQPLQPSVIEQKLLAWFAMANVNLQPKYYLWLIAGVFILIALVFIGLLISLRRKIKHAGSQSITTVNELVKTGKVSSQVPTFEVSTIINTINQLSKPLHTEADFQLQKQQFLAHNALMSRHTGNIYWQMPIISTELQRKLSALLAIESSNKHWRYFFSRIDVRAIIKSAKRAKNNRCIEKISLTSIKGKAIALTIEYVDGAWCGSVCSVEKYRELENSYTQLQQKLKQQNQIDKLTTIASSDDVLSIVSNVMVHRQQLSLTQVDESFAYHQLYKLIHLSEQQKTCAQLRQDDFVLTLSTVSLANEIHTALANVSFSQAHNNNQVYVTIDDNLASLVTLERQLFQTMFATICRTMFTDQQGVELDVELSVIEKNSAQQKVNVSFTIKHASHLQVLLQVINELALCEAAATHHGNTANNYLQDLQLVFNVNNKVSQLFDEGGKFSFDMPFALAEGLTQQRKGITDKLVKRSLLVIATEKPHRERICQALANSKAVVETMQDLVLFQRQISIKHLTKHPIDVIILSSEVYVSDYDLITQHVTSLPSKLQPKILVLQPFNCKELKRAGLFSQSNLPWFSEALVANVEQLVNSKSKTNLLVEPEIFTPYRFAPSHVEVLVGLVEIDKNQGLVRLLQWLGLQVTLVSHQEQLERLWQSGRFLLVISEFSDFNVVINENLGARRGVFIINHSVEKKLAVIEKCNKLNMLHTDIHVEYLVPVLDIQKFTEQLSPWLISSVGLNAIKNINAQGKQREHKHASSINSHQSRMLAKQKDNIGDIEQFFDFNLDTEVQQGSVLINDAFDLNKYAQNQGSAELAAFMLDDYLADIVSNSESLIVAMDEKNIKLAKQALSSLIKLAKVIAAMPLLSKCEALLQILGQYNSDSDILARQADDLKEKLDHIKQSIVKLTEFAEAI